MTVPDQHAPPGTPATDATMSRDPVCGMTVDMARTPHHHTYAGREFGFCSASCMAKFIAAPEAYLVATDPVCGMAVDRASARWMSKHDGVRYYFDSEGCHQSFAANPEKYLNAKASDMPRRAARPVAAIAVAGTKYTCPMHPQIVRDAPGDCPICGMTLEPMGVAHDDAPNPELADFTRRLWVSAIFSVPLLIIAMAPMVGIPIGIGHDQPALGWIEFLLASPVMLWAAQPFFRRFWASLVNRSPNMWTLIGLGTGAAYLFSIVGLLFPGIFPRDAMGMDSGAPLYFEASAVIIALVFVGQVLELRAREQTGKALRALFDLAPKTARVVDGGLEHDVPIETVKVGDLLRVRPRPRCATPGACDRRNL